VSSNGETFFLGGKEVAANFGMEVLTAVKIEYYNNKWWFVLHVLGEYIVNDIPYVPRVQHVADIASDEESVAINAIKEGDVLEESEKVVEKSEDGNYYHFERNVTKSMARRDFLEYMVCCLTFFF
jgi:hypothetical protein